MLRTETWVPPAAFGLLASQSWRVLQHTVDSPHLCTFTAPAEIFLDALAEELVAAHVLRFQQAQMQQRAAAQAQQQGAAAGAQQQGTAQPAEAAAPQPGQPAPSKDA